MMQAGIGGSEMDVIETVVLPIPISGSTSGEKYDREYAAFRRMLPTLMQTKLGQYVAIHEERVITSGADRMQVVNETLAKIGNVAIHVGLVGSEPSPTSHSGLLREVTNGVRKS
jgi:hypothetical protein